MSSASHYSKYKLEINYLQYFNARQLSRRGASSYGWSNTHVQTNTITTQILFEIVEETWRNKNKKF